MLCCTHVCTGCGGGVLQGKNTGRTGTVGSSKLYLVVGAFLLPAPNELSVHYSYLPSSLCMYQEDGVERSVFKLLEKLWKVPYTFSSTAEPDDLPVFLQESFLCLK